MKENQSDVKQAIPYPCTSLPYIIVPKLKFTAIQISDQGFWICKVKLVEGNICVVNQIAFQILLF